MRKNGSQGLGLVVMIILLGLGLFPGGAWGKTPYYEHTRLDIAEVTNPIADMACDGSVLYIAMISYNKDAGRYLGDLIQYDLKSGAVRFIYKDSLTTMNSLAVWGDKALTAGVELTQDVSPNYGTPYFTLINLADGAVLDKITLDLNCYECYGYDIQSMGEGRFAVSQPGQNKVLFVQVDGQNKLAITGETHGLREAKGLFWHEGLLYVGGSTRVNHETRGAIYTVDPVTGASALLMTVMESRGGFNGVWVKDGLLVASNYHNVKLFDNSLFVFDLNNLKLVTQIDDLPLATARICFGGSDGTEIYASNWGGGPVALIKLDFKALKRKAKL